MLGFATYAARLRFAGFWYFDASIDGTDGADFLAALYASCFLGGMMRWNNDYHQGNRER
jgi:hypothetical protein